MLPVLASLANAQEPPPEPAPPDPLEALVREATTLLDDRRPVGERIAAAQVLADSGDPRALAFLRAATRDRDSAVKLAAATAALRIDHPDAPDVARALLLDPYAPREDRLQVVKALGELGTDEAAATLHGVTTARGVSPGVRAEAFAELERRYPEALARLGRIRGVADPLGGLLFVTAGGLAGGLLLSSAGALGEFDGSIAVGAVGGSAIGLGTGALFATSRPLTAGEGLSFASGVSFGLAYGAWTTTAVHGGWRFLGPVQREDATGPAAGWRALGVFAGSALGAYAITRDPSAWDVLEVDTAGYLGSAIVLGATGVAFYRVDEPDPGGVADEARREASRWLAASTIAGATAGLATGAWLAPRWELGWDDAAFATVLAGEGAWIGTFGPTALGVDDRELKGTIRLPLHALAAAGLALAEARPVPLGRSGSTTWGALAGNVLGAGLPMTVAYDDPRSVAVWMVPVGAVGTLAGYAAHPWVDPDARDAALVAVATSIAGSETLAIGLAMDDLELWTDSGQGVGLALVTTGVTGATTYALGRTADVRVDRTIVVGCAAAWGGYYGGLVPMALQLEPRAHTSFLSAAATEAALTGLAVVALTPAIDLAPRATVVPQLGGLTGATGGALVAALASREGDDVALGSVAGATLGFLVGGAVQAAWGPQRTARVPSLHLPGRWTPAVGATAAGGMTVGIHATGL